MFLSVSDFTGKFELHTGMYDAGKLNSYIARYEKKYLVQLFGVNLYNDFLTDLIGNTPQSPNFLKVFNPFIEQLNFNSIVISEGILDMLKGFIYFEYAKDLFNQMTPFGNVSQNSENSTVVTSLNSMMYTRYNESVKTHRAIQRYMFYNSNEPIGQLVNYLFLGTGIGYTANLTATLLTGGSGNGLTMDVNMSFIGGVVQNEYTIDNGGTGYTNLTDYNCSGGSGTNCVVTVQTVAGVVQNFVVKNSGEGYNIGETLTILGGNNDAQFTLINIGIGSVKNANTINAGNGYVIGDVLTIEGASIDDATIEVTYVGIGNYQTFAGIDLQFAYWI